MTRLSALCCAIMPGVALAQLDASVPDAMVSDAVTALDQGAADAAPGCGMITYQGECAGDLLRYCAGSNLRQIDCSSPASFPRGGPRVTCGLADCTGSGCQGYWCVAKLDAPCGVLGCDVSQGLGCIDGSCQLSSSCDPQVFTARCDGDVYVFCTHTESHLDCSADGQRPYTCLLGGARDEPCVGLPGADCNVLIGKRCAPGLACRAYHCVIEEDGGWIEDAGLDAGRVMADAQIANSDAGGDPPSDGEGCLCAGSGQGPQTAFLLLFAGLGLARRRRPFNLREAMRARITAARPMTRIR